MTIIHVNSVISNIHKNKSCQTYKYSCFSLLQAKHPNLKVIKSCFSHFYIFIITLYSVCTCWFNIGTTKCNYDISVIKSGPFLTAPKMLGVLSKWVSGVREANLLQTSLSKLFLTLWIIKGLH